MVPGSAFGEVKFFDANKSKEMLLASQLATSTRSSLRESRRERLKGEKLKLTIEDSTLVAFEQCPLDGPNRGARPGRKGGRM